MLVFGTMCRRCGSICRARLSAWAEVRKAECLPQARRTRVTGPLLAGGIAALLVASTVAASEAQSEYVRRVEEVRRTPGFVALWDFVKRDQGQFAAYTSDGRDRDFRLDAINYVRDYWNEGRDATYEDFPLLGRGPFGQAVRFRGETDPTFRPCLVVPRNRLHGSRLDVGGPKRSVSMVVWVIRDSGNHAIAGIWHEGTDLRGASGETAARVERGRRQYALFAGLAANNGASAVHVSENGASSFGDRYARNLAVTREVIPAIRSDAPGPELDAAWTTVGFTFDNQRDVVTAYINGEAADYWIDDPQRHPFFKWPAEGWRQAQLRQTPGTQEGEDPAFPEDQFYAPPERKPISREWIENRMGQRIQLLTYAFTKVRVRLGERGEVLSRELASLRVNPFWFGHDLYAPAAADGGPFTIGRVIHMGRSVGFTGFIGGVAMFDRSLSERQMRRLMSIGRGSDGVLSVDESR